MFNFPKFRPPSDAVAIEQVVALRRRAPIHYLLLILNTIAVGVTHADPASPVMTLIVPTAMICLMLVRIAMLRHSTRAPSDGAEARAMLHSTTRSAVCIAVAMLAWAMWLYPQEPHAAHVAKITTHGQVVLYVGMTVVCCISLLMHATTTAILVTLSVVVPFAVFLFAGGTPVETAVAINLLCVAAGMIYVVLMFARDFEELVTSRQDLSRMGRHYEDMANTDALTGLSNRRSFYDVLDRTARSDAPFSVLIVDLDGFKQVNDLHGHPTGDLVLQEVARRIVDAYPVSICLSRLGGDEFGILCGTLDAAVLKARAEVIVAACSQPLSVGSLTVSIGASVGISVVLPGDVSSSPNKYVERADYALTSAKRAGKGRVEIFAQAHEDRIRRVLTIETALRVEDLRDEIAVVFQPIVSGRTGAPIGFEALARWTSTTLGVVPPAEFVPVAERSDLIHALTRIVIEKALTEAATWPERLRVKINLSARDLTSPKQMTSIVAALHRSPIAPDRITFELTETAFESDLRLIEASIAILRGLGASLAIDDFGTGYSSLSYIHRLKPSVIKIDRSFVSRLGKPDNSESIVRTISELCLGIGARSLAEGVETAAQRDALVAMGIEELQGYFFAKPMPASDVLGWIAGVKTDRPPAIAIAR